VKVKRSVWIVIAVVLLFQLACGLGSGSTLATQTPVPTQASVPTQAPAPTNTARPAGDNPITEFYVLASEPGCEVIDNLNETILLTIRCRLNDVLVEYAQVVSEERVSTVADNFRKGFSPLGVDEEWSSSQSGVSGLLLGGHTPEGGPAIMWTAKGKTIVGSAVAVNRDLEYLMDWFDQEGSRHYISSEPSPEPTQPPVAQGDLITDFFVLASDPSCEEVEPTQAERLRTVRCSFSDGTGTVIVAFQEWVAESAWNDSINSMGNAGNVVLEDTWKAASETAGTHGPYVAWLDMEGRVTLVWGVDGYRLTGIMLWYNGDVAAAEAWFFKEASRHTP